MESQSEVMSSRPGKRASTPRLAWQVLVALCGLSSTLGHAKGYPTAALNEHNQRYVERARETLKRAGAGPDEHFACPIELLLRALKRAGSPGLLHGQMGMEGEANRVNALTGLLSQSRHPRGLGSKLTNASWTTDYGEALTETITPPLGSAGALRRRMWEQKAFLARKLESGEGLWAGSMPPVMHSDTDVRIASYGRSGIGRAKERYRERLALLPGGRKRQAVAGTHFNHSFSPEFIRTFAEVSEWPGEVDQAFTSDLYFRAMRNFERTKWLVPYLFGDTPAMDRSFLSDPEASFLTDLRMEERGAHTLILPYGTSLRSSREFGYGRDGVRLSMNGLEAHANDIYQALATERASAESALYADIRAKNSGKPRLLTALGQEGVIYLERRNIDLFSHSAAGIDEDMPLVMEALAIFNALSPSPFETEGEIGENAWNANEVALRGRTPRLALKHGGNDVPLVTLGRQILNGMRPICRALDGDQSNGPYQEAFARQVAKLEDPALTPSAQTVAALKGSGLSFHEYTTALSARHRKALLDYPLDDATERDFEAAVTESLVAHAELERRDSPVVEPPLLRFAETYKH